MAAAGRVAGSVKAGGAGKGGKGRAAAKAARMPLPGRRVRGSDSGRPIMALLDLLGRRWVMRLLWELRTGALNFRELQARCGGMSPSVLNQRLAELREAMLVESAEAGYALSGQGQELLAHFAPLNRWAEEWAKRLNSRK